MHVWRLCRKPYATDPIGGRGGLYASGRWHSRGTRIVYTSESLALAAWELYVHVDMKLAPADLVQIEIDVPDDLKVEEVDQRALPSDWHATPAPVTLQNLGNEWIDHGSTPVLRVPSAVILGENNYLLNPAHSEFSRFSVVELRDFQFDSRTST